MNPEDKIWLQSTDPGTRPADLAFLALEDTFVSGDLSGHRLSIRYFQNQQDRSLLAKVLFGPGTQGPPDHAHGGSMAALLDEAMGGAAWLAGYPVVAAQLNISFHTLLPLGTRCLVEARVQSASGRKIETTGRLVHAETRQLYCSGQALFVTLDREKIENLSAKAQAIVQRLDQQDRS